MSLLLLLRYRDSGGAPPTPVATYIGGGAINQPPVQIAPLDDDDALILALLLT